MQPKFQQRHFDYVMGGPNLQSTLWPGLATVAGNTILRGIPLTFDPDAPFVLTGIAARVKYDSGQTSHRETGLNQIKIRFTNADKAYLQQSPVPLNLMCCYGGQLGLPKPIWPNVVYPASSTVLVDITNAGATSLTNLTIYFRGFKLFPWGAQKATTYPKKFSTIPFTYDGTVSAVPITTSTAGQRNVFNVYQNGDFVLRAIQAGRAFTNLTWEIFGRFYDSNLYPYSNDFVHFDVLAGNSASGILYPTAATYVTPVGPGASRPGLFCPEIYIPYNQLLYYDILRQDGAFGTAAAQDYPISFIGAKVFAQ